MSSAFSTNDTECLNRETEHSIHDAADFQQIWDKQRLKECVQFIDSHQFNKVSIPFHSIFVFPPLIPIQSVKTLFHFSSFFYKIG